MASKQSKLRIKTSDMGTLAELLQLGLFFLETA